MRIVAVHEGELMPSEAPDPRAEVGQVVIDVAAAGVNRADILQRQGRYPSPPGWPAWPGLEVAGTVAEAAPDVTSFAPGDSVCALVGGGGYATRIAVPAALVAPVPDGLSLVEAAGLVEAACTVWSNFDAAGATAGEAVLIHGGSGGVGTVAIQYAAAMGMEVFATAGGPTRAARLADLGVSLAIDYRGEDFAARVAQAGGADVILDVAGGAYLDQHLRILRPDGRLLAIGLQRGARAQIDLATMLAKRLTVRGTTLRSRAEEDRARIVAGVVRDIWPLVPGRLRPIVHAVYPLAEAAAAHAALESGEVFGTLVLDATA